MTHWASIGAEQTYRSSMATAPWNRPHPADQSVLAWHVMSRLTDRRVIARSEAETRHLVALLYRSCHAVGVDIAAFSVVDTHIHLLLAGPRFSVGEATRRLESAAVQSLKLGACFDRCYAKPVDSQAYLRSCFGYVLRQTEHHGSHHDPYLVGSSLLEILGLRGRGRVASNVKRLLPRTNQGQLAAMTGVPWPLDRMTPLTTSELPHLLPALMTTTQLRRLPGRGRLSSLARAAAVHAVGLQVTSTDLAKALGCSSRSVRAVRGKTPPRESLVAQVRGQVRFRIARAEMLAETQLAAAHDRSELSDPARASLPG